MIDYTRYTLDNGLTVILHEDTSTPLVTVNVLYKVGSRNENPDKTGFAHLFEHLMFGGSANVPDYDTPIQEAGGDNNAFTNSDLTNFYNVMPAENLETALWLESDRMLQLDFSQKSLDVQKKVVVEEFKETSINQPYGDLWHQLTAMAYTTHPYRWPTIGLVPKHIEDANLEDVKSFFGNYYKPNNAVLVIAGKFDEENTKALIQKWFGSIPASPIQRKNILPEPKQAKFRTKTLERDVPSDALYLAFHMPERSHKDFQVFDLVSEILSGGRSGRLYQNLLKRTELFSSVSAYITGSIDPGLFIIEAKFLKDVDKEQGKELIWKELNNLVENAVGNQELQKVKNSLLSSLAFSEVSITNKAINMAFFEMLGDIGLINKQEQEIDVITAQDVQRVSKSTFQLTNCTEINYNSKDLD